MLLKEEKICYNKIFATKWYLCTLCVYVQSVVRNRVDEKPIFLKERGLKVNHKLLVDSHNYLDCNMSFICFV